jgi:hypothetical protein
MDKLPAEQYLDNAAECMEWAEAADNSENREAFLHLARVWSWAAQTAAEGSDENTPTPAALQQRGRLRTNATSSAPISIPIRLNRLHEKARSSLHSTY